MKGPSILFVAAIALSLVGAPNDSQADYRNRRGDRDREYCDHCGTVRSVQRINYHDRGLGAGTIIGALVGGAIGNQVGKGDGRKAATVVGALAGGAVGRDAARDRRRQRDAYRINIRMDSGRLITYDQDSLQGLRSGDRVSVRNGYVEHLN